MIENYSINSETYEVTGTFEGQPFVLAPKIVDDKLVAIDEAECIEILTYREQSKVLINENLYKYQRASAYPSIQEQLDMQYWDAINGTTTWQDAINAVKQQFPKE